MPPQGTAPRPDDSRTPGEWIARYVRQMLAHDPEPAIDYAVITHFHPDHMGAVTQEIPPSKTGAYRLTGITDVGDRVPIRTLLDRAWPDYSAQLATSFEEPRNYTAFVDFHVAERGMVVERFEPGQNDQIVLTRAPDRYPTFEVRNIAANGEVWTGVGTATRLQFPLLDSIPEADQPTENQHSLALRLSYGKFDYYTGGDLPGRARPGYPAWQDIETPVAKAVGPVDAMVLNHHGNRDSTNAFFVSTLRPRVVVIPVWSSDHPGHDVIDRVFSERLYPGPRDVFATGMIEANKLVVGRLLTQLASDQGHIVIRVDPGCDRYRVIVLDDTAETYRVTAVHGPYESW